MAQVTIYLPDEVEKLVRREAQRARKSVSAYMAELATRKVRHGDRKQALDALRGSWEGKFPEEDRLEPLDEPEL